MESAERNGSDLRRRLRSADRFNDAAIRLGSFEVKTPRSRVSASLRSVTCRDQRRPPVRRRALEWRRLAALRARRRRLTDAVLVLAIVQSFRMGPTAALSQRSAAASVPLVPRTRSSHTSCCKSVANFGFKRGTKDHKVASVPLIPKFASGGCRKGLRTSESGHRTAILRHLRGALSRGGAGSRGIMQ
jgi:hypothetical protein